jgi:hypothetical protein
MGFLLDLHPLISFLIVAVVCVGISWLGLMLVRKRLELETLRETHEVSGMVFNAFGLIYAVLVAFVVFATWTSYDTASQNAEMEANKLSDLFLDASAFPDSMKNEIRVAIRDYTKAVVEQEWEQMADRGHISSNVIENLRKVWSAYLKVNVRSLNNPSMYDESLRQLNSMSEYRRLRWFASRSTTPLVIWLVLVVGGITSVVYTFFFGTKNVRAQYMMTGVLALINSMVLFLIYILDHPFSGYNGISSEPFRAVLMMFTRMLEHGA